MREAIRRERRVELGFEENRYPQQLRMERANSSLLAPNSSLYLNAHYALRIAHSPARVPDAHAHARL